MTRSEGFVGLDVGKFEIFLFSSKTAEAFSVPNTLSGYVKLQSSFGLPSGQIIALEPMGGYEWESGKRFIIRVMMLGTLQLYDKQARQSVQ